MSSEIKETCCGGRVLLWNFYSGTDFVRFMLVRVQFNAWCSPNRLVSVFEWQEIINNLVGGVYFYGKIEQICVKHIKLLSVYNCIYFELYVLIKLLRSDQWHIFNVLQKYDQEVNSYWNYLLDRGSVRWDYIILTVNIKRHPYMVHHRHLMSILGIACWMYNIITFTGYWTDKKHW